jgi:hypothetical protein
MGSKTSGWTAGTIYTIAGFRFKYEIVSSRQYLSIMSQADDVGGAGSTLSTATYKITLDPGTSASTFATYSLSAFITNI